MNPKTFLIVLGVLLVLLCSKGNAWAGENKWSILSMPAAKDSFGILIIDPTNPNILYASVGDTGVLKSIDGGNQWHQKNNGLKNRMIQKIVIHPFYPKTLYSCTMGGLYRSLDAGENWEAIGFTEPATPVNAIAMTHDSQDTLYAAIGSQIFRSRNAGKEWTLLPSTLPTTILTAAVSRLDPRQLYVGTEKGVYKIQDRQDSIEVVFDSKDAKPVGLGTQRVIDLVVDVFHTKIIFALFEDSNESAGVYWVHENEWFWREMNQGFDKRTHFPLRSLNLSPKQPRILYSTNHGGAVLKFEFAFPRIGLLDLNSTELPIWDLAAFSQSLAAKLGRHHSIKWLGQSELNAMNRPLTSFVDAPDSVLAIGKRFGFDLVVSGYIDVDPDTANQLIFTPQITFVSQDKQVGPSSSEALKCPRDKYQTAGVDLVLSWIHKTIGFQDTSSVKVPLPKGGRNRFSLGFLAGLGTAIGGVVYVILARDTQQDDTKETPQKLPLPPRFP